MEKSIDPRISLSVTYDINREMAIIRVADNGHGMPDDVRQKLFQPHFTTKPAGHGLGLSNSKKIIDNHGGDIAVESVAGEGTTFTICLPRKVDSVKSHDDTGSR